MSAGLRGLLETLDFAKGGGTISVVAQDARTGAVLMVARADREAVERTLATGEMHYTSRTRGPWHKGATSGNVQRVVSLHADCDGDAVLALVEPAGPACHSGARDCFGAPPLATGTLAALDAVIRARAKDSAASRARTTAEDDATRAASGFATRSAASPGYTGRLLADRNLRLKKLGEEVAELVAACADGNRERAVSEAADLHYHMMVALRALGAGLDDVARVLGERASPRPPAP